MKRDYLVTAAQMQEYDKNTMETIGIEGMVLMERAACAVSEETIKCRNEACLPKNSILIVAGGGNNGADAIAAGRIMKEFGYDSDIYICTKKINENVRRQKEIAEKFGLPFNQEIPRKDYSVIIDGIF